ncbi:glycoside hydrolase family 16 protein [Gelidibacter salicanalis]|uniref:Glycoside hydrolase family 16 protein n=2 Tax=Gelidibacter salicanalis TaxID=291193 RepID=A0A934KVN3_9FLAO|nr:glycoside hydrolase family 16 protein [Gelidibacter salicanalis]
MNTLRILCVLFLITLTVQSQELIFEEHFNGDALDATVWNYELGDGCPNLCGWGNNERQIYTQDNVKIQNGYLVITAAYDGATYTSGKINTKDNIEFQYGTVEVRAKLAVGKGIWPAIWMLGSNISEVGWPRSGEIDIMEYVGKHPHEIHTTLHTPDSHGQSINTKITTSENIEEGFHLYKAHWTKDFIKFYIDDALVYTFSPEVKDENTWPFDHPYYLILNLAIGGNFGGPEVDDTIFPQQFLIDYVKIYK